jgi:16S rRNA (guanine(966)-N(2))-methyltransferase RsmD
MSGVRPTSDRVKESIFDIIGEEVTNSTVLDLFAGSGSLGIEALSRGAKKAVFVESNHKLAKVIWKNLTKTKLERQAKVICSSAANGLSKLERSNQQFSLIFLDPPYKISSREFTSLVGKIFKRLEWEGLVVLEQLKERHLLASSGFTKLKDRCYGATKVTILRKVKDENSYMSR